MNRRTLRTVLAGPLAVAVLSGCGPSTPISLDVNKVSLDIGGGQPPAQPPQVAPPPSATAPASLPQAQLPLPTPPSAPTTTPTLPSLCPAADQFAVPALNADPLIAHAPKPATYVYRQKGQWVATGALAGKLPAPPLGERTITAGSTTKGYDFAVAEQAGAMTRTTAYNLVSPSSLPTDPAGGLYLAALQWKDMLFGTVTFRPTSPMLFLQTPVVQGESFTSTGADPQHKTSMLLRGQVAGKKRVNACGKIIDTWQLEVTEVLTTTSTVVRITATYDIATQYGGISVRDVSHVTGNNVTASGVLVSGATPTSDLTATINQRPKNNGTQG
jgi:hypothetical protein